MAANPFLDPDFHIRWTQLAPELIGPAVDAALAGAAARVDRIATQDIAAVTWESTFLALEEAAEELNSVWGKVTHLQSVADAPALREAHNAALPKVSAFLAGIPLRADLWQRLKAFAESPAAAAVAGVHRRLLEETLKDFRQAGADLPAAERARLEALQAELAQITQKYGENVLDATNAWELVVTDEARLAGLPEQAKAAARSSAEAKGKTGWRFTLQGPSAEPFMSYVDNAGLRREMWLASTAVGALAPHDNGPLVARILELRAEKARLLGKLNFADLVLERRMAGSARRALEFVADLQTRAAPAFAREAAELEAFKAAQTGGPAGRLAPWETAYWAEKLRRAQFDFDEEALRPYFPLPGVVAGMFELVRRIFGLRVAARPPGETEVWHPEVTYHDVHDAAGRHLGSFYADWHPRESKRGGAWMNYLITGGPRPDGSRAPHLGLMCGNMTPPAGGRAALLSHREVETVFHEFGHLLHHLLGEVPVKSLNGTNVAWDFVELPSQIMENWCWEREGLDLFARHHETGAPIPEELFRRLTAAKNFRTATATLRQIAFAKMDLLLHLQPLTAAEAGEVESAVRPWVADCLVPTEPPAPTIVKRFNHLFSDPVGYAAGYYSYKWAEVLEADAFTRFKREGIFDPAVGADFVRHILSRGNSADPMTLYRGFMGREPQLDALLRRAGLAA
ncbi:MAG: oligopeptidase A [Opitutia bacterium Tous-C1TDCM]|nr:MAG: oligopeptidase A [Opitutae bacterium Tous-C1TDCM]